MMLENWIELYYKVFNAAVLELVVNSGLDSEARKGVWVRIPPAVPNNAPVGQLGRVSGLKPRTVSVRI